MLSLHSVYSTKGRGSENSISESCVFSSRAVVLHNICIKICSMMTPLDGYMS